MGDGGLTSSPAPRAIERERERERERGRKGLLLFQQQRRRRRLCSTALSSCCPAPFAGLWEKSKQMNFLVAMLVFFLGMNLFVAVLAASNNEAAKRVLNMEKLWAGGVLYMIQSKDKLKRKTLVFVRHGESEWNETFNRGKGLGFLYRLVTSFLRELHELTLADSLMIDSPLSSLGKRQAEDLFHFMNQQKLGTVMYNLKRAEDVFDRIKNDRGDCKLVSSNLRRAMATAAIGFGARLRKTGEKIQIVPYLQEITRNIDAVSTAAKGEVQSRLGGGSLSKIDTAQVFDPRINTGSKPVSLTGSKRIELFAQWLFSQKESTIVASGHSLYFKTFLNVYLPKSFDHVCKRKKMKNAGVITFDIVQDSKGSVMILQDTLTTLYLGYCK